jgi:hypothetical protein
VTASKQKRWFKKDIKFLCDQIDYFAMWWALYRKKEVIRMMIEEKRSEIVVGQVEGFRKMLQERADRDLESANNARDNPDVWEDSTEEMIERFMGLYNEEMKAIKRINGLLARIKAEGLPPEVDSYLPEHLRLS